jgi:putative transposase
MQHECSWKLLRARSLPSGCNAVVESFFGLMKREWVNRVRYRTRAEARADVFEYIECFYNRKRRHGYLGNISPVAFENKTCGLYETVH